MKTISLFLLKIASIFKKEETTSPKFFTKAVLKNLMHLQKLFW